MPRNKKDYRILVIEDNPGDFALVEDFLFEHIESPVITQAKNFKEVKEHLTKADCEFDIILLDITLPDNTHETLIRETMALCNDIPVIVLTGYTDFVFGVKSLSLGISDYLLKDELTALSLYKSIIYSIERKHSIADLKESEKRYSDLFQLSPLPAWVCDMDTLKFLDINLAAINHYGYSHDEFLSMTLKDIRPTEDIPIMEKNVAALSAANSASFKIVNYHKKKSGELFQAEVQVNRIPYKGKTASIAMINDVTERVNHIKAIEDQNEKFKEISWMQSHVVRAPLARIMGLISLINNSTNEIEKQTMLNYITLSANELDDIIQKITDKTSLANYEITGHAIPGENDAVSGEED